MTAPFFRIPREIRDRIYHLALLNQRAQIYVANLSLYVDYLEEDNDFTYDDNNLRWLFTSRQVLGEGLDQFYARAHLQHHSIGKHDHANSLTLDGSTSIFDLKRVKYAELNLHMGKSHHSEDDKYYDLIVPRGKERWAARDEDFSELGKVIKNMDSCAFEELKLTVSLFRTYNRTKNDEDTGNRFIVDLGGRNDAGSNDGNEDDDEDSEDEDYYSSSSDSYSESYWNGYGTNLTGPDWTNGYLVDFDFLKNLGTQWKRVKIEYIPTYMLAYWGDEDPVEANIVAVPIIQQGLAEIAKELVGGQGWVIRDSLDAVERGAARWLLDAERKTRGESLQELNHLGLRSYLAECDTCGESEETYVLQPDKGDGIIRFKTKNCGGIVEIETPVVGKEM